MENIKFAWKGKKSEDEMVLDADEVSKILKSVKMKPPDRTSRNDGPPLSPELPLSPEAKKGSDQFTWDPPLSPEPEKKSEKMENKFRKDTDYRPNLSALQSDGSVLIDPPTDAKVEISKDGHFIMNSGCKSGTHTLYHVILSKDGMLHMQNFGVGTPQLIQNVQTAERINREIQQLMQTVEKTKKDKAELPGKQLDYLVRTMQQMEKKLENLEGKISKKEESEGKNLKSILKKEKIKKMKKNKTNYSDLSSSTDTDSENEEEIGNKYVPFEVQAQSTCTPNDYNWKSYLDRKHPLYLPNMDYVEAWMTENKPKLKLRYTNMRTLQNGQNNNLKSLALSCSQYNNKVSQITGGNSENYSITNISKLTRSFIIRFGVSPKLFSAIFVEFCLSSSLKSLAMNNSMVMQQGEEALLKWLSQRTLNKSSETRLKIQAKEYLKKAFREGKNMSKTISDIEGIIIPELLLSLIHI